MSAERMEREVSGAVRPVERLTAPTLPVSTGEGVLSISSPTEVATPMRSGGRRRRERDLVQFGAAVTRMVRTLGRRFEREGDIEELEVFTNVQTALDEASASAVEHLVSIGFSWAEIGRGFGLSGEGARRRWGGRRSA